MGNNENAWDEKLTMWIATVMVRNDYDYIFDGNVAMTITRIMYMDQ